MSIDAIIRFAYKIHQDDQNKINIHFQFEKFITPIVRAKFKINRFELQYKNMCSPQVQKFIEEQEKIFLNRLQSV